MRVTIVQQASKWRERQYIWWNVERIDAGQRAPQKRIDAASVDDRKRKSNSSSNSINVNFELGREKKKERKREKISEPLKMKRRLNLDGGGM